MPFARIALVVALAIAAVSVLPGGAVAQVPDPPDVEATPPLPRAVTDRLPEDLQQRHPWVFNDAPFPLSYTYAVGSYDNLMKGVTCFVDVASENPNWRSEDMRYTEVSGGVRCNLQVASITGYVRALSWSSPFPLTPNGTELARASFGAQNAVPPGHGVGWQAYATAGFTRASDQSNQVVHTHVTIELPLRTGSRWDNPGPSCVKNPSTPRFVTCDLYSSPYRHVPYPCPTSKAGAQAGAGPCASGPAVDSTTHGVDAGCGTPPVEAEGVGVHTDHGGGGESPDDSAADAAAQQGPDAAEEQVPGSGSTPAPDNACPDSPEEGAAAPTAEGDAPEGELGVLHHSSVACHLYRPNEPTAPRADNKAWAHGTTMTSCAGTYFAGATLDLKVCLQQSFWNPAKGWDWDNRGCRKKTFYGVGARGYRAVSKIVRCYGNEGVYRVYSRAVLQTPNTSTKIKMKRSNPQVLDCTIG